MKLPDWIPAQHHEALIAHGWFVDAHGDACHPVRGTLKPPTTERHKAINVVAVLGNVEYVTAQVWLDALK